MLLSSGHRDSEEITRRVIVTEIYFEIYTPRDLRNEKVAFTISVGDQEETFSISVHQAATLSSFFFNF